MVDASDVMALLPASEQRRLRHCRVVSEITKGHGSMAWQLADEDATYFLKVHLRDHRLDFLVPTLEVVHRHGISTPRILHAQRDVDYDAVSAIVVMDWVDGEDLGVALPNLSSEEIERVGLSIGSNLADLHSIRLPGFSGSVGDSSERHQVWGSYVASRLEKLASRYMQVGLTIFPSAIARLVNEIRERLDELDRLPLAPTVVHRDLYENNIMLTEDGDTVFLDFEHSKAWEPLTDFSKLELILFRREPRLAAPLCAAYLGALDRIPDAIGQRVFVAVALELVWGIPFFVRIGDDYLAQQWLADAEAITTNPYVSALERCARAAR